ncbi:MAG: hypothetical protein J6573_08425 [Lactobacillus sp.]|nr:hypothetical protein [Lactobacillus sp.]
MIYLKNYEEVKKLIDIVDISKNYELTVNISTALSNLNDTNYANKILDNFSGSKVSNLIYGNKSVILYNLAHYKKSLDYINKALELDPNNNDYIFNKLILLKEKYPDRLEEYFDAIKSKIPNIKNLDELNNL